MPGQSCSMLKINGCPLRMSSWRRGALVVSALDVRSEGRWFEPGFCRRVVSLDKKRYSTLSLFKWVPAMRTGGGGVGNR